MKIPTTLTVGLAAVALVVGGGAAIAAGQPSTDTSGSAGTTADTSGPAGRAADAEATPTPGQRAHGFRGLLHSESVVSDGQGGFVTRLTQVGTISSVDADRLTVVSEDGYQRSWTRSSETAVGGAGWSVTKNDDGTWTVKKDTGDLATGDAVMVAGTLAKDSDTAVADRITPVPTAAGIPGTIRKRLGGELRGRPGGLLELRDRRQQRFEDGPSRRAVPAEPSWSTSPASFT